MIKVPFGYRISMKQVIAIEKVSETHISFHTPKNLYSKSFKTKFRRNVFFLYLTIRY